MHVLIGPMICSTYLFWLRNFFYFSFECGTCLLYKKKRQKKEGVLNSQLIEKKSTSIKLLVEQKKEDNCEKYKVSSKLPLW